MNIRKIIYFILGIDTRKKDACFASMRAIRAVIHSQEVSIAVANGALSCISHYKHLYAYEYKNRAVREAIHRMKFNNDSDVCDYFADVLAQMIATHLSPDISYTIIPVPSTRARIKERGAWTTKQMTDHIVSRLCRTHTIVHAPHILTRKETVHQARLPSRAQRREAMHHVFCTHRAHLLKDTHIICIDDVYTTGATIKDIARVCAEGGCASFVAWTIAH